MIQAVLWGGETSRSASKVLCLLTFGSGWTSIAMTLNMGVPPPDCSKTSVRQYWIPNIRKTSLIGCRIIKHPPREYECLNLFAIPPIGWTSIIKMRNAAVVISSPEPKAHWWAYSIGRHPSSVVRCMSSVCQHFQISSPQKPLGQLKSIFMWRLYESGEWKFLQTVMVTWPRWPPCPYMPVYSKNLKKFSSLEPKGRWPWNLVYSIGYSSTTKFLQMMTLGWPWPILWQGQIWSLMLLYWEKGKTVDFSETIIYDLKLATVDQSDKKFPLASKLCPLGAVYPLPWGYIHVLNHEKNWIIS